MVPSILIEAHWTDFGNDELHPFLQGRRSSGSVSRGLCMHEANLHCKVEPINMWRQEEKVGVFNSRLFELAGEKAD